MRSIGSRHSPSPGWLFVLAFALALAAPRASAQPAASPIEELQIDLWPEYDRPEVLVLYKFRLAADRSLDEPVPLPVPASVGEPHAVAWRDAKGALFVAEFNRNVAGDRATISMRMGSREGQLEFYDRLERDGDRRTYRFQWPGGIAVKALSFRIQRPAGASDLQVVPAPARQWQGEDGLAYALVELGPQDATATPAVEVSYVKTSEALSVSQAATTPPASSTPPASASPPATGSAPPASVTVPKWAVGLGGLLVALLGGWLLWSSRSGGAGRAAPPRESKPSKRGGARAVFCHRCGTKAEAGHSFCMSCGTKLVRPK